MAGRRLKVFQAQFGFYDTVVAAPSQAAALRAWGVHQDLFATGQARLATDPQAIAAAVARPQTPLRRAVGSQDAFALEPKGLPAVPTAPGRADARSAAKAKPKTPARPTADRSRLDAAETALRKVDDRWKRQEAAFHREAADLEARRAAAQNAYAEARRRATAEVVAARSDYRAAGGGE